MIFYVTCINSRHPEQGQQPSGDQDDPFHPSPAFFSDLRLLPMSRIRPGSLLGDITAIATIATVNQCHTISEPITYVPAG
jgi:hypothetical protein